MFFKITIILLLGDILLGSVAPNPFLRPGSKRKPPPPVKPILTPKPIVRPNVAKELEFKGYFILNEKIYFSLFNKKVNHGEWITISEKTYEDFTAESFDLETETLTIIYEGQSFDLKLLQSTSGSDSSIQKSITKPSIKSPSPSSPNLPRYMPPKPKNTPQIPSWLVNRKSNNSFNPRTNNNSSTRKTVNTTSLTPATSLTPQLPYPGFIPRRNSSSGAPAGSSSFTRSPNNNAFTSNKDLPDSTPNIAAESVLSTLPSSTSETLNNQKNVQETNVIDLENLPPPPPPPNILPPSPPPNLLPSRE